MPTELRDWLLPVISGGVLATVGWTINQTLGRMLDKMQHIDKTTNMRIDALEDRVTDHMEDCDEIDKRVLFHSLQHTGKEVHGLKQHGQWVGDCLYKIANKMQIDLPHRPGGLHED